MPLSRIQHHLRHGWRAAVAAWRERKYHRVASAGYGLNGYDRVYLHHIRKTGGASLNRMFLRLSGEDDETLYRSLAEAKDHRVIRGGLVYAGWVVEHINAGNWFYAFSHEPLHRLDLPPGTFTVACFRDPVQRVLSHYRMLVGYRDHGVDHACMAEEGAWLGETFDDFLERIPRKHLCNQLYMFSRRYDVHEAAWHIRGLSHYFFSEQFASGVMDLNWKTGLELQPMHTRQGSRSIDIRPESLARLREMLADEYRLLGLLQPGASVGLEDLAAAA